jgi:hypothetical protein
VALEVEDQETSEFLARLQEEAASFNRLISTNNGDRVVKGFIDVFSNVYTISGDTKVVSKLIELMLFPRFVAFAARHGLRLVLSREQNHYPDLTFLSEHGTRFAVDLKSTYHVGAGSVSSMTLGAFTGYFSNRASTKNVTFPTGSTRATTCLASSTHGANARRQLQVHTWTIGAHPIVVKNLQFFRPAEVRLAADRPGSATRRTSVGEHDLRAHEWAGTFAAWASEDVFDAYWMYYRRRHGPRGGPSQSPYTNLAAILPIKGH